MKKYYQRNYQNEDMKSRNVYNNKLDKLKLTYGKEMQNKNDHFLKTEPKATTGDEEKLKSETKNHNRNSIASTATINEEDTVSTTDGNTTTGNKNN